MKSISVVFICLNTLLMLASCKKSPDTVVIPVPVITQTDNFSVSVNNGYGSGTYKTGDTVHIFTNHYADSQLFDKWTGDVSLLNASNEWHTWFIMPAKNVSVTGSLKTIPTVTLQLEQIKGKDRLKPVYYYFPTAQKGVVFLLHGTGGKAAFVAAEYEFLQLTKDLVSDGFGVVITEAEEATTGIDSDGDGKLRWAVFPVDTLANVDYANIRIITNTFYDRGLMSRSKPKYCVGMSNGGAYSAALSAIYRYKAGVSYCAQSAGVVVQTTVTPFQYCMARFDNNENVGQAGNTAALSNSKTLTGRGVCSAYFIKQRSPLYPERFARRGDISITQSMAVFNELKAKNYIDSKNYYIGYSDVLIAAFQSNPTSFPAINSLTAAQRTFMLVQIDLSVSDHQMYSDYNRATLKFLNTQCQ